MKKICFFKYDITSESGADRVMCLLMNELINENEVYCISLRKGNEKIFYKLDSRIKIEYLLDKKNKMDIIKAYFIFIKILFKKKIDIVIDVGTGITFITFVSVFFKRKHIVWEHSNVNNKMYNSKIRSLNRIIASFFSTKIITLTEKDKKNYIKKYKVKAQKIEYIYNFLDSNLKTLKVNYDKASKKIITVGRFDKVKGYDRLVEIGQEVLKKNKDWEWHIYGDGPEFKNIENKILELKLEDRIKLMGKEMNIYPKYKEYSFYVMTSYYEGLPMVLLEAQQNNLPIISFDCETGPSEIISNNINGYLIEDNNISEMINKINYLIDNLEKRIRFSSNSKLNLKKFKKDEIIKKWKKLIVSI